ncbi:MAG TPA: SIS domain-containing protein [Clostridia bacterium]|nr:SIS domain-containing protein [Clostridia bacterium]
MPVDAKKVIAEILQKKGKIKDVFFAACGGSLVEFYPVKYFVENESSTIGAHLYTARELLCAKPKTLTDKTITFICSHSGNTQEAYDAAVYAKEQGSTVITFTFTKDSKVNTAGDYNVLYGWGDDVPYTDGADYLALSLANELLHQVEEYPDYEKILFGLSKIDGITRRAEKQVQKRAEIFAAKYYQEPILYVLGSGPSFGNAYGFSICSLMEMQWMHSSYIHSAEYFHGPFEVTDKDTLYVLLENSGKTRMMDERALTFLKKYAEKYEVIDSKELGIDVIDADVVDYFSPNFFYYITCVYRSELAKLREHPLSTRRYMGKVEY